MLSLVRARRWVCVVVLTSALANGCTLLDVEQTATTGSASTSAVSRPAQVRTFSDLVVDPDFEFKSTRSVVVGANLPSVAGLKVHFVACSDYEETDKSLHLGYRNCVVRGDLDEGKLRMALEVPGHVESLALEARPDDGSAQMTHVWHVGDGDAILIE